MGSNGTACMYVWDFINISATDSAYRHNRLSIPDYLEGILHRISTYMEAYNIQQPVPFRWTQQLIRMRETVPNCVIYFSCVFRNAHCMIPVSWSIWFSVLPDSSFSIPTPMYAGMYVYFICLWVPISIFKGSAKYFFKKEKNEIELDPSYTQ